MKRVMVVFLCLALVFTMAACSTGGTQPTTTKAGGTQPTTTKAEGTQPTTTKTEEKKVIGVSLYYLRDEYYQSLKTRIELFAAAAGYEVIIKDADTSPSTQQQQIEDFIVQKVDAIALSACNPEASVAYIKEAVDAGIPVLTFDGGSKSTEIICHLGFDSYKDGAILGEWAAKYITENLGGVAQVATINFPQSADVAVKREQGFLDEVTKLPGVEVVAQQDGGMDRSKSMTIMENILSGYPGVDVVFGVTYDSAAGAESAIKAAKVDCIVLSVGWAQEAFKEIEANDPVAVAIAAFDPNVMAEAIIQSVTDFFDGKALEPVTYIQATLVDKTNIDTFPWK